MENKNTLIVALGNPLEGDDGFGAAVLARLREDAAVQRKADLIDAHSDLLGKIEGFNEYEHVVLIDAVLDEDHAGCVEVYPEEEFTSWPRRSLGAHQLSVVEAVRLFRTLNPDAHVRIDLVGLSVAGLTAGEGVSFDSAPAEGESAVRRALLSAAARPER